MMFLPVSSMPLSSGETGGGCLREAAITSWFLGAGLDGLKNNNVLKRILVFFGFAL